MPAQSRFALLSVLTLLLALLASLTGPVTAAVASPTVTLSPAIGVAGSSTTLTAAGFPRKSTGTLRFAGTTSTVRTDQSGRLSRQLSVPAGATGTLTATVTAGAVSAAATFTVTVPKPESTANVALRFGITTPGGPAATAELDEVAALAGEAPSIVLFYRGFAAEPDLSELDAVAARGATPLLTWEPYDWTAGVEQPQYALARLRDGSYDPYLRRWADALRSWGRPVLLRFGHEMNGSWYPWAEGINGNVPGEYTATWRHIHDIFTAAGASNVSWVWSPNISYTGSTPMAQLYPGDAYVDWLALDGYNWGTSASWHSWTSPAQVFDASLTELAAIAPGKPIMIAETASTELGGDKAVWIGELFDWLGQRPQVRAMVWFQHDKETDWRINSSPAAAQAFAAGLVRLRTGS